MENYDDQKNRVAGLPPAEPAHPAENLGPHPALQKNEGATPATMPQQRLAESDRPCMWFTLSKDVLGWEYMDSGFSDADLRFAVIELTPGEERRAINNAGQMKILEGITEMTNESIYRIGSRKATYDLKNAWLKAIGPRARKVVDTIFNRVNGIEESEGEAILATGTLGRA